MMARAGISGNVVRLGRPQPHGSVEDALAAATGDASIRLLYHVGGEPPTWVDLDGAGCEPEEPSDVRAATAVELGDEQIALVEHAAATSPAAIEATCAALAADLDREHRVAGMCAQVRLLERTEQRLRDVFDAVELMVIAMDLDATMTYVNPFTERLSGWTRNELIGGDWFEMFRSGRESFLDRVRAGEFPPRDHSTIIVKNDERHQIDWYNVALRDEHGRIEGVLGIGRDTTEEVRTQRSLEAAHRRMHDVLETIELVACQLDLDGRITYVNEYLIRLCGWTRDELIGRRWLEVFQTGDLDFMQLVRQGDFPAHDMSSILLRSGERRDIEWANVGLHDDHGQLIGLVGIGRDMTDQLRIERDLRDLAAEHGALERVATEVARGLHEDAVFALVAEQAGRLVEADGCTLVRVEPDNQVRIVSNWSEIAADRVTAEGMVVPMDAGPAMAATFRTGRPARSDQAPDEPGRPHPLGEEDDPIRSAVAAPITVTGEMWGALIAWRVTEQPLSPDTERRLGAFASLAGTAIANADAGTALAASRKRIVTAADDARRRLERNLHDGAQQRFVSLSLALRLTQSLLDTDPAAAAEHLRGAQRELAQGLDELRELARGIHPAILTERGLRAAVDSLVLRAQVPVDITDMPACRLPGEVEAAAYYVVSEALTNVTRYAGAGRATVAVACAGNTVTVEVADDGAGGADPAHGSGLRGLADRVEAIDGRLEIVSPPGAGTRIRAVLPFEPPADP
jgi:PAS domain S-box-containing protein